MEEEHSLAWEMLKELKESNNRLERTANKNSKQWFIISIVELVIIVGMVIGFFIYESQYEIETTDDVYQYVDDTEMENSTINQNLGE